MSNNDDTRTLVTSYMDAIIAHLEEREKVLASEEPEDKWVGRRKKQLEEEKKSRKEIEEIIAKEKEALEKKNRDKTRQQRLDDLKEEAEYSLNAEERKQAEKEIRRTQNAVKLADYVGDKISKGLDSAYSKITQAADYYSNLVSNMQTRLIGSSKSFESISKKMSEVFAYSPFFSLKSALDKTNSFIDKGIAFNIEVRASMAVLSEKVAKTFNAFDGTLIRLIRIQQQDSTQARLGMENILTKFLNANYNDTSYLTDRASSVRGSLLEATSRLSEKQAVEYEMQVQKWLGSFYSQGAGGQIVDRLATAIGQMGSGDIQGLSGNTDLQALLVASANKGGVDYGELLMRIPTPTEIDKLFKGFLAVIKEIESAGSENLVVLNQYAKVFGLSVSDLTAMVKNISMENVKAIEGLRYTYEELNETVKTESTFRKLFSRTGGGELTKNIIDNIFLDVGSKIGKTAGGYLAWQMAGLVNEMLSGISVGIKAAPLGIGTTQEIDLGKISKAITVMSVLGSSLEGISSKIGSAKGINFSALVNDTVSRGTPYSLVSEGSSESYQVENISDYSLNGVGLQKQSIKTTQAEQLKDSTYSEQEEKMKKTEASLLSIRDNVAQMARLMSEWGEKGITSKDSVPNTSYTPDSFFSNLSLGRINR